MKLSLRSLIAAAMLVSCSAMMAQDDPEYRMEIGAGLGLTTYEGDFNGAILSGENMTPSASILLRRVMNPRSALRFALGFGSLKGSSKNLKTYYPDFNTQQVTESAREPYEFKNTLVDFNALYEYNFFPYGTGRDYRGAKRLTPYLGIGLGFTFVNSANGTVDLSNAPVNGSPNMFGSPKMDGSSGVFTANLPIAFGVKYKLAERVNLTMEWMVHFTLSDKLDGVKDPYRVESSGIFKNTDCYSNLQVSLTYSFWEKCRTCHKE
ncbi:MAG: DUF6089 family protein [Prevotellaceae bacterium]|nr:DUF6089 family protein [Prevotellaceae bacterium]